MKFDNFPIYKSGKFSQCWQDAFVYSICGNNGSYIEIGASWPIKNNNTYSLEIFGNYKGFSVEFNKSMYEDSWKLSDRKNKVYWENALNFNYRSALDKNKLKTHVNYLSCDIEPPENTFLALQTVVSQGITFDVITFEHELFKTEINYNKLATEFLLDNNYKVAVSNVYHKNPNDFFETWFVNKNINFKEQTYAEWKQNISWK